MATDGEKLTEIEKLTEAVNNLAPIIQSVDEKLTEVKKSTEAVDDLAPIIQSVDGKLTEIENLSQAVNALAPIIESLKHDDYILPIVIPFISAFLGALGAYEVAQRLEKNKRTKEMIAAANTLIVTADECFSNLLGLKRNYYPRLTSNPL